VIGRTKRLMTPKYASPSTMNMPKGFDPRERHRLAGREHAHQEVPAVQRRDREAVEDAEHDVDVDRPQEKERQRQGDADAADGGVAEQVAVEVLVAGRGRARSRA